MHSYEVYGRPDCPWCEKAEKLLRYAGVNYSYTHVYDPAFRQILLDEWGVSDGERTWPQVFVDGKRIGGYTELKAHLTDQL